MASRIASLTSTFRLCNYDTPRGTTAYLRTNSFLNNLEQEGTFQIWQRKFAPNFSPQTTLLNILVERQVAGVVGGERLVNGYPLPSDFQTQTPSERERGIVWSVESRGLRKWFKHGVGRRIPK
ncbi:hypothetical protein EDB83DRAFT_2557107 [Lactarius deliciosus]|nr:hypothetical protein EDB83DRAFT_2557107 [Lactarius deliciosus]